MRGRLAGGVGEGRSAVLMEAAGPASSRPRSSGTTGTATLSRFPRSGCGQRLLRWSEVGCGCFLSVVTLCL